METVACNLCGSTHYSAVYEMSDRRRYFPEEMFTVVACDECGLGFVNPRPSIAEIQKYYPAAYYDEFATDKHREYLQKRFREQAKYLQPMERRGGEPLLLDVGCANGDFPRYLAAHGWRVEGVETSESSRRIRDFRVYTQQFQEIPATGPVYDAVTAWAVLEHVHDPMAYFLKAASVLKSGGRFVFLVQNFQSLASRYLFCEDVPRHLYFFDRHTIRRYVEAAGMQLEREDNNRKIYKMAPYNWFAYHWKTRIKGQEFTYRDVPLTHREYVQKHGLKRGFSSMLKHAAYAPSYVADRIFWPLIENMQILQKTYGISTFVARKP